MDLVYHTLDVFTDVVFGGNPLAVFPDGSRLNSGSMQRIAREMNLSETVFLMPPETATGTRRVRIFTPARELPFAGHPTIGTAWFLALTGEAGTRDGSATLILEENVGPVPVEMTMKAGRPTFARFTTAMLPEHRPGLDRAACARLLSLAPEQIGAPGWESEMVSCGVPFLIVPVRDLKALGQARLDPAAADELLGGAWASSVYLTSVPSGSHVRARMYGHGVGVTEDPATGSAAASLAGYLAKRAIDEGRKDTLVKVRVDQGVEMGRPSVIEIEADVQGGAVSAVRVGGRAVTVAKGVLSLTESHR